MERVAAADIPEPSADPCGTCKKAKRGISWACQVGILLSSLFLGKFMLLTLTFSLPNIRACGFVGYYIIYVNLSKMEVIYVIFFSCPEQLNRFPCPLLGWSVTTNNQSLQNTTE